MAPVHEAPLARVPSNTKLSSVDKKNDALQITVVERPTPVRDSKETPYHHRNYNFREMKASMAKNSGSESKRTSRRDSTSRSPRRKHRRDSHRSRSSSRRRRRSISSSRSSSTRSRSRYDSRRKSIRSDSQHSHDRARDHRRSRADSRDRIRRSRSRSLDRSYDRGREERRSRRDEVPRRKESDTSRSAPSQPTPKIPTLCRYFKQGYCKNGEECPFTHATSSRELAWTDHDHFGRKYSPTRNDREQTEVSLMSIIKSEISDVVERDYRSRILTQLIIAFMETPLLDDTKVSQPLPQLQTSPAFTDSLLLSPKSANLEDIKSRRTLPSFKKIKHPDSHISPMKSRMIKKTYRRLLQKSRRHLDVVDQEQSSSESTSSSSDEESDEEETSKITEIVPEDADHGSSRCLFSQSLTRTVDEMVIEEDLVKEKEVMDSMTAQEQLSSPTKGPRIPEKIIVKKHKPSKKPRKTAKVKEPRVYKKPERVPVNFQDLDDECSQRKAQDNDGAVPATDDEGNSSDDSLDFSLLDPSTIGAPDSEDETFIYKAFDEEVERRRSLREFRNPTGPRTAEGLRRHMSGSARTEGFYQITSAEKKLHLRLASSKTRDTLTTPVKSKNPLNSTFISDDLLTITSRANRVAHRHLAFGLETQKKAIPIDSTDSLRFNQLKSRKKRLKFAKSEIHDWGLFAMERIEANEMIIEYIGEKIRQKVADTREREYERQGIGSSYLFRVDEDVIIDATKTGNLARFINHSCEVSLLFLMLAQLQCADH